MTHRAVLVLAFAVVAAVSTGAARAQASRPECAAYEATVYFDEGTATLPASATPLLREAMDRIAACRSAGGRLKRIVITARADASAADADEKAVVRARGQVLRKALVEVGAPRRSIRINRPAARESEPMQRRTEFAVEMQ